MSMCACALRYNNTLDNQALHLSHTFASIGRFHTYGMRSAALVLHHVKLRPAVWDLEAASQPELP